MTRRPDMKAVGVQQAEHRIDNVVRELQTASQQALTRRRSRIARDLELQRQGAALALDAVHELQRNYRGRE